MMVAQFSMDFHLYCNAAGLSSPTGDGMADADIENIRGLNNQGPTLGIGLCFESPTGLSSRPIAFRTAEL